MNGSPPSPPPATSRGWMPLLRPLPVFVIAAAAGAGLLGVRWAVRGNADPFNIGWPLYLQFGSLALTLWLASLSRRPFASAFGLFLGLVTYLLVDGRAEYPAASVIALAVNGLLPALAGALFLVLIRRVVVGDRQRGPQ